MLLLLLLGTYRLCCFALRVWCPVPLQGRSACVHAASCSFLFVRCRVMQRQQRSWRQLCFIDGHGFDCWGSTSVERNRLEGLQRQFLQIRASGCNMGRLRALRGPWLMSACSVKVDAHLDCVITYNVCVRTVVAEAVCSPRAVCLNGCLRHARVCCCSAFAWVFRASAMCVRVSGTSAECKYARRICFGGGT